MRWYCVHPSLPPQAELRIRSAPDSSAPERARISQGRAIAACSPVFEVPSDEPDAAPVQWLQVAFLDASEETEGGFMMAALPDGMALVTPWEETDFYSCCEVQDPSAKLYDGPQETAQSVGAVERTYFPYCVLEESGLRARIFHPELESVWVDKSVLHTICTRLQHCNCGTPHSFYVLNETLPEEAQIAIRAFPSKEAQTVGLLSRGETLEATTRGGNWLRIVGGSIGESFAWIMWRTDALELLTEVPTRHARSCTRTMETPDSVAADESPLKICHDALQLPESNNQPPVSMSETSVQDSAEISTIDNNVHTVGLVQKSSKAEGHAAPAQTDIVQPSIDDPTKDDTTPSDKGAIDVNPEQAVQSWDDRPIRPAPTVPDDVVASTDDATVEDEAADTEPEQAVQSWDDRPIRPAPTVPDDVVAQTDVLAALENELALNVSAEDASSNAWDDIPVGPRRRVKHDYSAAWEDTPVESSEVDIAADKEDAAALEVTASWDDRPIGRAPPVPDDMVAPTDKVSIEEGAVNVKDVESAASDDRQIEPTPSVLKVLVHTDNAPGDCHGSEVMESFFLR
ncbi:hypothetical protein PHYBOEH_008534 [Phytophthora boehmeriae]|uniref:SH3 domain-containing protein n=1 Tax=Phytophthora boehmeriae TaxID=109152 RepID=A0A8T1XDB0_9STRA|nr:hypothetical protein PHYBOEH_008534 [Phytophthora boehmeriae]